MLEPDHDEAELQNDSDDFLSAMVEELESLIDEQLKKVSASSRWTKLCGWIAEH